VKASGTLRPKRGDGKRRNILKLLNQIREGVERRKKKNKLRGSTLYHAGDFQCIVKTIKTIKSMAEK